MLTKNIIKPANLPPSTLPKPPIYRVNMSVILIVLKVFELPGFSSIACSHDLREAAGILNSFADSYSFCHVSFARFKNQILSHISEESLTLKSTGEWHCRWGNFHIFNAGSITRISPRSRNRLGSYRGNLIQVHYGFTCQKRERNI